MVTSTLIGSGHAPRRVLGSVNAAEFFATIAVATTFFIELGASHLEHIADSDATRTVIPIHCGQHSDDRGQLVRTG